MTIPERYAGRDAWPHRFTKTSGEYEGDNGRKWQDMICVHCELRYTQGKQERPIGVCRGRSDSETYKRLGVT